jgi:hypothetical protein
MTTFIVRDVIGWGVGLWLFGYILGFVFYGLLPPALIGWYVMPLGIAATVLALWRWVTPTSWPEAAMLGLGWCVIAIVLDYLGIVTLLNPPDGYYKLDVYVYYLITLLLPLLACLLQASTDTKA